MVRTFGKWFGRALLALALAAIVIGLWKREEITRLMAVNSLFSEGKIVSNFSNMDDLFLTTPVPRGDGAVVELPRGFDMSLPDGFDDWLERRSVTAILVLKDGDIRHEAYLQGTQETDRRIGWSIAKSYVSALFGIVLDDGKIKSLDDQVTDYAIGLAGSAYQGATIRDVLQMSSGVVFNEDYLDYDSDINKMGRTLALGGRMDDFAASLFDSYTPPGTEWNYVSIDTHVLAMVLRGATGMPLADLLSDHILSRLGQEQDAYYVTDGAGVAFALGGLNLTLRDYARFGLMIANGGRWNNQQIVPAAWIDESTLPSAKTKPGEKQYGYQWWMASDARDTEYFGQGIYGQYLYIDEPNGVVIVSMAADRQFREPGVSDENIAMFRSIVENLKE